MRRNAPELPPANPTAFLALVLLLSGLATLLNPFGWRIYVESYHHWKSPLLQFVAEWAPLETMTTHWWVFVAWQLLILLCLIRLGKRKALSGLLPMLVPTLLFTVLTYSSRRYFYYLTILSIPLLAELFREIRPASQKAAERLVIAMLLVQGLYVGFVRLPEARVFQMSWFRYAIGIHGFSPKCAQLLQDAPQPGPLFSSYDFGGWLIWNYPTVKPCIDGRMHLWSDAQGASPFLYSGEIESNLVDIDSTPFNTAFVKSEKPVAQRLFELTRAGRWQLLCRDRMALVFVRRRG